jgi:hypothetical protein
MKVNKEIRITSEPLGDEGPIITLNSLNNVVFIVLKNKEVLVGTIQIEEVITKTNSAIDTQFNEKAELVEGSKIENRFVIIFIYFLLK